jgi:hypothetical protein
MKIARHRGMKKAIVALARRLAVINLADDVAREVAEEVGRKAGREAAKKKWHPLRARSPTSSPRKATRFSLLRSRRKTAGRRA